MNNTKTFNDYFPNVFVISPLDVRFKRRLECFDYQMKHFKISYNVHRPVMYSTVKDIFELKNPNIIKSNIYNDDVSNWASKLPATFLTFCHFEIVKYAFESGFENVCIFEDDVLFHKDFLEIFKDNIESLPNDWELFYLGAIYDYHGSTWVNNSKIFKTIGHNMCGHAYCLSRKGMEKVLKDFEQLIKDERFYIFDLFLASETKLKGLKTFGILPKIAEQGYFGTYCLSEAVVNDNLKNIKDFTVFDIVPREEEFESNKSIPTVTKEDYTEVIKGFTNFK